MKKMLISLSRTPWVARQAVKWSAYAGTVTTGALAKAQIMVEGQTIDLLTPDAEVLIASAVVTVVAAAFEGLLSYAAAKYGSN